MILLDTNVVSEMMKARPSAVVETWLSSRPASEFFLTAITEAELRYGVAILPAGRRQKQLAAAVAALLEEDFADRIFPFDSPATVAYAQIASKRRSMGRPMAEFDAQIAAIAKSRGATLATRNIADFSGCHVEVIDPWSAT